MGLEWQTQNTEAQKPVENTTNVESSQNLEQELSPEQVEQIMAKVRDINKYGTAFSVIRDSYVKSDNYHQVLRNNLKNGMLGFEYVYGREARHTDFSKESWKNKIRQTKKGVVHFNIVGRSRYYGDKPIANIDESYYGPGGVSIVFDLKKFREVGEEMLQENNNPEKINTYKAMHSRFKVNERNEFRDSENRYNPESELGFTLSHRVPPRFFQALVIDDESPVTLKYLPREYVDTSFKDIPKEVIAENTKKALDLLVLNSMFSVYHDNMSLFLPIYDAHGNLLWPKQMSYEEVKKFVAERDAKNINKEGK